MEVSGSGETEVVWEVIEDHVVKETKENDEIGLWGFGFNFFDDCEGGGGETIIEWFILFVNVNWDLYYGLG